MLIWFGYLQRLLLDSRVRSSQVSQDIQRTLLSLIGSFLNNMPQVEDILFNNQFRQVQIEEIGTQITQRNELLQLILINKCMIQTVIILSVVVNSLGITYHRLQYLSANNRLTSQDQIVSTLGLFKLRLIPNQCLLQIQMFNQTQKQYIIKGKYTSKSTQLANKNCSYLEIAEAKLITNQNLIFLQLNQSNFQFTSFTIDDNGIIRLASSNQTNSLPIHQQSQITQFQTIHPNIKAYSNALFDKNVQKQYTNLNNWTFSVQNGILSIFKATQNSKRLNYDFKQVVVSMSGLFDINRYPLPFSVFENITYSERCEQIPTFIDFKGPFTLVADQYWPIFRIYQQSGYIMFEIGYNYLSQYHFPSDELNRDIIHSSKSYSPCPSFTFQFRGNCLSQCPTPYYHQIRSSKGYCTLFCQQTAIIKEDIRLCSCYNSQLNKINTQKIYNCPPNSNPVFYGCKCQPPNYFDILQSLSCIKQCPLGTFGFDGLCMICPANCLLCQRDISFGSMLSCIRCQTGYLLLERGRCSKLCNSNYGLQLLDNKCETCQDPNCLQCLAYRNVCSRCSPLYTLEDGKCLSIIQQNIDACSNGNEIVHYFPMSSVCLQKEPLCLELVSSNYQNMGYLQCKKCSNSLIAHGNSCVVECPFGFINVNSSCKCVSGIKIGNKCVNLEGCPIKMWFDIKTFSCLSCPVGCVNCFQNICTSCSPGYFFKVSPTIATCEKNSPLATCIRQFLWKDSMCIFTNYDKIICFNIPNCLACTGSICMVCVLDYYLYNNTCVEKCPQNLIMYKKTCILSSLINCQINHIQTFQYPILVSQSIITTNKAYSYYIKDQLLPHNIPIGYIPYIQQLMGISDETIRQSYVEQIRQVCLKCKTGYGVNQDMKCEPCPVNCLRCYKANNNSCLQVNKSCPFVDEKNNCLQSCFEGDKVPVLQNGRLYCKFESSKDIIRVDSAVYTLKSGLKIVYFVFSDKIDYIKSVPLMQIKKINGRNLQVTSSNKKLFIQNREFIQINDTTNNIFVIDVADNLVNLKSQKGYYFPNTAYGVQEYQSHVDFMKTWLSNIGFIMASFVIILHVWFVGNHLIYKMDNLIIYIQSIYYFSFIRLLVGKLLSQFYYGWIWAHCGFFPNYFINTIPDGYHERYAPISYKISTLDANIIRNAGYSISIYLTYLTIFIFSTIIIYCMKDRFRRTIWSWTLTKDAFFGGFEFFSMNMVYWSVGNLLYNLGGQLQNQQFYNKSVGLCVFLLIFCGAYCLVRIYFNLIGGLYMGKRILLAVILASGSSSNNLTLAYLIVMQGIFLIMRYIIERPERVKQIVYLLMEQLLIMGSYVLMFLSTHSGVNTIVISTIVFVFIVLLSSDLSEVYLESLNQWIVEEQSDEKDTKNEEQVVVQTQREMRK